MRVLRTLIVSSLVVTVAACGGDDDGTTTEPSTTAPAVTLPDTTAPETLPDTTLPTVTLPDTTAPETLPDTTLPTVTLPDTTIPDTLPDTTIPDTTTTEPGTTTSEPAIVDVRVYFLRGEQLAIDHRDVEGPAVLRGALAELLAGPTGDVLTAIPDGTTLLDVNLRDGTATVDLSGEFEAGGGSMSMLARIGQVVFTATQFDNVDDVVFWLDGSPIEFLGGEGIVMTDPWARSDVPRELTGGVLIDTPRPGDTVTSPFTVTGEGDVYEGQFPIEIRRDGDVIALVAPVTTGAWGDWADFEASVVLDAAPGPIELVAFDEGGCGDAPECPPIVETVVPLTLG